MLGKAIALAAEVHEDQKDKGGKAYILHPIRIMMRLRTDDEELLQIAILHDVIEDSDWTLSDLHVDFSARVIQALSCLTHKQNEPYEDYIKRVATNRDAILVKIEDLRDNSNITRLKGIGKRDFKRMEKYHKAFTFLSETLKNWEKVGY